MGAALKFTQEEWTSLWETNRPLALEIHSRLKADKEQREDPSYVKALFGPQYRFFRDPSKKKAALCSRRAGKTEAVAAWLLDGAEDTPGGLSVYVALTRNNCRLILWATLQAIEKRHKIGLKFKEIDNQLMVVTKNGHAIWLAGCKDAGEVDKFRGLKIRRAAIDEGASYGPYLKTLVDDVLEPALLDLDGELAMIGTPGVVPTGYFFEITTGAGTAPDSAAMWSTHSWTCVQNPHIQLDKKVLVESARLLEIEAANDNGYVNPRAREWLDEKLRVNKWKEDHPTYLREWMGMWVRDDGALCYPIDPGLNYYRTLPAAEPNEWTYAIGCDVGYEDDTSFVVGCYRAGHPEIYIVHVEKRGHMIPSAVAARLEMLQRKYNALEIVMDTGGIGKGYAEECSQRYGLFITPAKKSQKRAFMEIVRGEILVGNIKFNPDSCYPLLEEASRLVWNEDGSAPDDRFPDHACDALTYLCRWLMPSYDPKLEKDPPTDVERAQSINDSHRARVAARIRAKVKSKSHQRRVIQDLLRKGNEYY